MQHMQHVIDIHVTPHDLASIRFAYSPMMEIAFSLFACDADGIMPHQRWLEESKRALHNIDLPYIKAVIPPKRYLADFVTPTPLRPTLDLQDDFDAIRATPPDVIRKNIQLIIDIHGHTPERQQFLMYPLETLECLLDEIRLYWDRALAHHWNRIVAKLDDDIMLHTRHMGLHGTGSMLNQLTSNIRFEAMTLHIDKDRAPHPDEKTECGLDGQGLVLVPNVFRSPNGSSWQVVPEFAPMVIYGAFGGGLWYHADLPDPERDLVLTLGEGRARVLLGLRTPANTSELARMLNMTAGATSQHLKRLGEAGLVRARRQGYFVYYMLTERGQKLLDVFAG